MCGACNSFSSQAPSACEVGQLCQTLSRMCNPRAHSLVHAHAKAALQKVGQLRTTLQGRDVSGACAGAPAGRAGSACSKHGAGMSRGAGARETCRVLLTW